MRDRKGCGSQQAAQDILACREFLQSNGMYVPPAPSYPLPVPGYRPPVTPRQPPGQSAWDRYAHSLAQNSAQAQARALARAPVPVPDLSFLQGPSAPVSTQSPTRSPIQVPGQAPPAPLPVQVQVPGPSEAPTRSQTRSRSSVRELSQDPPTQLTRLEELCQWRAHFANDRLALEDELRALLEAQADCKEEICELEAI